MRKVRNAILYVAAVVLAVLPSLTGISPSVANQGVLEGYVVYPIRAETIPLLQELYLSLPAPAIAAAIPEATCWTIQTDDPEFQVKVIQHCEVEAGCLAGTFGFALDGIGRPIVYDEVSVGAQVAANCADGISDPVKRAKFVSEWEALLNSNIEALERELAK